jgi:hypothetical protein
MQQTLKFKQIKKQSRDFSEKTFAPKGFEKPSSEIRSWKACLNLPWYFDPTAVGMASDVTWYLEAPNAMHMIHIKTMGNRTRLR